MNISYAPQFRRQFRKLHPDLQEEVIEKIEVFKDSKNYKQLKVHKLKGMFKKHHSFSVNYQYRILFQYLDKGKSEAVLLVIGDHDVYKD
ncbi:MAG TPA: type II toxin-antitoxin system mRNA interferase toxin, RelE/StbE family [Candidatus Kaiserbacteria bacterium]|nr:type II toxin-antitoxin system mRNA interferase toxin, RelE/StbE family [Candidatus Kaiserbacteria bacterium]